MESTIYKTILGSQMESLFEASHPKFSIRYYAPTNGNVVSNSYYPGDKYKFEIVMHHNEGTDAHELFDEAFCKMFQNWIDECLPTESL